MPPLHPKKLGIAAAVTAVICLAIAATILGWQATVQQQQEVQQAQQDLEQLPALQTRLAAIEDDLNKRQLDIQRIEAFIISKEQLSGVVTEFENAGHTRGLTVTVPAVEEKQMLDENGNIVEQKGPLFEVRLKVVAIGDPKQLLAFLHDIEHGQRLTHVESFRLDAAEETGRNQATALQREGQTVGQLPAILTADIIIGVRREGGPL